MRIYAGQTMNLFQAGEMNPAMSQRQVNKIPQSAAGRRNDTAVISPQGKSSSLLANLMNQKELIQMNKDAMIKRSLDEENGMASSGLKEQLEEYEEQLEELDQQIAAEMAKQAESEPEKDNTYQNPQSINVPESVDQSAGRLTELSVNLENAQTVEQVHARRECDKKVCESEIETSGSVAAKHKLEKIEALEQLTDKLKPVLNRFLI